MTADDTTTASKAEEYVLLGDPEKTTALPDLPKTAEPTDKQDKTIVADTTAPRVHSDKQDKTVEATHAATYEAALTLWLAAVAVAIAAGEAWRLQGSLRRWLGRAARISSSSRAGAKQMSDSNELSGAVTNEPL